VAGSIYSTLPAPLQTIHRASESNLKEVRSNANI